MKKLLQAALVGALITLSIPAMAAIDQIIAVVNDDVITSTELEQATQIIKMQFNQTQKTTKPSDTVIKKQALDQLINKKLQLQAAQQSGIRVTEKDMDKAIENIARQNNISTETLYQQLDKEGMTMGDYRKEIREQLTMQKLQQREIVSNITVSPQEIDNFIASKAWQDNSTREYRIEDIIIPLSEKPTDDELSSANQKAKGLITALNDRQSLKQATKGDKTLRRSDLGWRKINEVPSAFVDPITHMKSTNVAGPIQTGNGLHVLRLVKTRSGGTTDKPSRKQAEQYLLHHKFEKAMQDWISKLRNSAFINTPDHNNTDKYA